MPHRVSNPQNPWRSREVEWLGEPPEAELEVYAETARSALSRNDSPDVPFTWSVNPYRGCQHACAYCYARPTHQFLDWGAGTDFDRRIVVKTNVAECLARELARPALRGETIVFSGVTDCYQALEAHWRLTRACLEVALARGNPVAIVTKSALVRRDVDVLAKLARGPGAAVYVSLAFADAGVARAMEPGAPTPEKRLETLRVLSAAGIPTGVAFAPLIPGLNESDMPWVLARAAEAGAQRAFLTLLRLPQEVRPVFEERLAQAFPERTRRVLAGFEETRQEQRSRSAFGERMRGRGARWDTIARMFALLCKRHGLEHGAGDGPRVPGRPARGCERQGELFGAGSDAGSTAGA